VSVGGRSAICRAVLVDPLLRRRNPIPAPCCRHGPGSILQSTWTRSTPRSRSGPAELRDRRGLSVVSAAWRVCSQLSGSRVRRAAPMPTSRARRLCPQPCSCPPNFDSNRSSLGLLLPVFASDAVGCEPWSLAMAFLDVAASTAAHSRTRLDFGVLIRRRSPRIPDLLFGGCRVDQVHAPSWRPAWPTDWLLVVPKPRR